jgi:CelD/BcsL family acetyltransferase involved in cellulose biosynthesis
MARRSTQPITVEVADAARFSALRPAWLDLLTRAAEPNVLMDPATVQASADLDRKAHVRVLLAWRPFEGGQQLVGVWAVAAGGLRKSLLPIKLLYAPPHTYRYLATPVVDRAWLDAVLDAMLDSIADDRRLPKILALDAMGMEGATMAALARVIAARRSQLCLFDSFCRPKLASDLDGERYLEKSLSGATRKKLRQHRRRLAEKGSLETTVVSEPAAVAAAIEDFLYLEAAGWKGRQGTALRCRPAEAAFMRAALAALARLGCASIYALNLDGRPVSMQIVARCGPAVFTLKTAYDEQFRDFSPGMLLLQDYTTAFLADPSIAFADSCSDNDSGFMSAWTERQHIANLWIDTRRGGSFTFRLLSGLKLAYRRLDEIARKILRMPVPLIRIRSP